MPNPKRKPPRDFAQEITDRLIARLEEDGPLPWRRPWQSSAAAMPLRSTGEAYKGVNHLLLAIETACSGHTSPFWMTFKQARDFGGCVRRGERSTTVIYYGTASKKGDPVEQSDGEDDGTYRFLKGYHVFNAAQIDGLPERFHPVAGEIDTGVRASEQLYAFFDRMPFGISHGHEYAAYQEMQDRIVMPDPSRFESEEGYFSTLGHEGIHASGVKARLNRDCFARYHTDKESRAFEELIAECGSLFISAHLGISGEHIDNHAAYLASWLAILKSDKRHIFKAAAAAQFACDWLIERGGPIARTDGDDAQVAA